MMIEYGMADIDGLLLFDLARWVLLKMILHHQLHLCREVLKYGFHSRKDAQVLVKLLGNSPTRAK
jgi:hypothetical protein